MRRRTARARNACKIDTGKALVVAGLHPATGGDGLSDCSQHRASRCLASSRRRSRIYRHPLSFKGSTSWLSGHSSQFYARHRCNRRTISNTTPPDGAVLCCLPNATPPVMTVTRQIFKAWERLWSTLYSLKLSSRLIYSKTGYGTLWNGVIPIRSVVCAGCCQCP